jgi:hypothetical protein
VNLLAFEVVLFFLSMLEGYIFLFSDKVDSSDSDLFVIIEQHHELIFCQHGAIEMAVEDFHLSVMVDAVLCKGEDVHGSVRGPSGDGSSH